MFRNFNLDYTSTRPNGTCMAGRAEFILSFVSALDDITKEGLSVTGVRTFSVNLVEEL